MSADGKRVHSESWMRAPDGTFRRVVSSQGDISALFADEHALYEPSRSPITIHFDRSDCRSADRLRRAQ